MTSPKAGIRLIRHEPVPRCGTFEVRFPDGRESVYFSWDDDASRRIRPEMMTQDQALALAKKRARTERDAWNQAQNGCEIKKPDDRA